MLLIVDDVQITRQTLRDLFERRLGWDVICREARNGREAIEDAERWCPDLVILDFFMPGMDGLAVSRVLKQRHPGIPIIMFTVYKDRDLEQNAVRAGVGAVISKGDETGRLVNLAHILLKTTGHP
jgi:two-component system, NarL family, vancomycin resistance associated response regulator VraR